MVGYRFALRIFHRSANRRLSSSLNRRNARPLFCSPARTRKLPDREARPRRRESPVCRWRWGHSGAAEWRHRCRTRLCPPDHWPPPSWTIARPAPESRFHPPPVCPPASAGCTRMQAGAEQDSRRKPAWYGSSWIDPPVKAVDDTRGWLKTVLSIEAVRVCCLTEPRRPSSSSTPGTATRSRRAKPSTPACSNWASRTA